MPFAALTTWSCIARACRRGSILAICAVLSILSVPADAAELQTLEIVTKSGVHVFTVEVVKTEQERATGLMYRRELPEGRGMLFDFEREGPISMWMKNTYVSLDMIFIRADGRIARIAENTTPQSLEVIGVREPVLAVLELAGGTTRKLGIRPGDVVYHRIFSNDG